MKFIHKKSWSKSGWQITNTKGEKYDAKILIGKVYKDDMHGNLLIIGNLYFVWSIVK